jgi:sortase A
VGWALIWCALLVFAFLGYQLFVTDLLNDRVQAEAMADLDEELALRRASLPDVEEVTISIPPSTVADAGGPTTTVPPSVEFVPEEAGEEGSTLGRMTIPALGVDEVIFQGWSRETLKMGPGHMPGSPVPGQPGNSVVSGHRTTYGRPFYDLDLLEVGDVIEVETAIGRHVFEIRRVLVVEPTDVWVTEHIPGSWITLTTCHPRFSAAQRLIIQAELVAGPNLDYANVLVQQSQTQEEQS